MGGAHTVQYVTVKADGSESFLPETVTPRIEALQVNPDYIWMQDGARLAIALKKRKGTCKEEEFERFDGHDTRLTLI